MKTLTKSIIAASFCIVASVPVYAGHGGNGRLHERLERQQERIEDGIQSRQLTRKESKILRQEQRRIRQLIRYYREDGRLSKRERRILNNKLDRASREIRDLKHNELTGHVNHHWRDDRYWRDIHHGTAYDDEFGKHRSRHSW